jgi:hypothetical protein
MVLVNFETEKLLQQLIFYKMKRTILTLSFAMAFVLGVKSQTPAAASANMAEMTFQSEIHDFGTIPYGGNGTYEFKFKNTGKEPLIITEARGSCGCTVPTFPKNVPIKPGDSEFVKVTYDTKRAGSFTKTVTIQSNAKTPEKVITIKGTVSPAPVEEAFPSNGKKDDGATPFEKH